MNITRKDIICYSVLPQILPRIRALFATGFQYVPYFMALVYAAVRLLPAQHPYLMASNMGKFGVRHVVAAAANQLQFSWRHSDQIILFVMVLLGLFMVFAQMVLLLIAIMAGPAMAAMPTSFTGFFVTASPDHDLAFMMLDLVFGIPDLFNSCISNASVTCKDMANADIVASQPVSWGMQAGNFPTAMHKGLHAMFAMYSTGLLVVAAFIFIYFIMTILAETMQSGTPFGKRYNHVWAPIRMVVAFGLLMPITNGLNSSQYIVLTAAKFGSSFATNGWALFNAELNTAYGGAYKSMLASDEASSSNLAVTPKAPDIGGLLQFIYTAKTCAYAETLSSPGPNQVEMYMVKDPTSPTPYELVPLGHTYEQLINFANGSKMVTFRFGRHNIKNEKDKNAKWGGYIAPICGEFVFPLSDPRKPIGNQEKGAKLMQEFYHAFVKNIWYGAPLPFTEDFVEREKGNPNIPVIDHDVARLIYNGFTTILDMVIEAPAAMAPWGVSVPVGGAVKLMAESGRWTVDPVLNSKGWAGAGLWYNRIAELNGAISTSILNIPTPQRYPMLMEKVYELKLKDTTGNVSLDKRYDPENVKGLPDLDMENAIAYWNAYNYWTESGIQEKPHARSTGNAMTDILNALLGTDGLFSMRQNNGVHPLAQLTGVGKSLIEASLRNLTNVVAGGAGGALAQTFNKYAGATISTLNGALLKFTMITITAGFILFYILPFLPFIYFTFAVGGWIKGIFEAMVGAPLWALAHIRIDGQGLAGQAAVSGYFLIFEIFLRPILMIFGLVASISTFSALVSVLNSVFDMVVSNVGGFDAKTELTIGSGSKISEFRGVIDQFFYTVMYVIVVYLMGMSSFKLIDMIPNQIMRWMGQSVTTFNDSQENAAQTLVGKSTQGAQQASSAIGGGLAGFAKAGGNGQ